MSLTFQIICAVLLIFGIVIFARAYHLGNQSMDSIGKNKAEKNQHKPNSHTKT
jgi:hypothetical protein